MHDDFASHLEHCGRKLRIDSQRNGTNRAGIGRHIFAKGSVTTRLRAHENAVFVSKIDGKPVKLEFRVVDNRRVRFVEPQFLAHTLVKGQSALIGEIRFGSDGKHGYCVTHLGEIAAYLTAHTQGRGRSRLQLRIAFFELAQSPKNSVVLGVRHGRVVQYVILVIPPIQQLGVLLHACAHFSVGPIKTVVRHDLVSFFVSLNLKKPPGQAAPEALCTAKSSAVSLPRKSGRHGGNRRERRARPWCCACP